MTDDELLQRLAKQAENPRAHQEDQLFERLALGELSPEEERLLERRMDEEPALRRRRELYRPFTAEETRSFVEHASAGLNLAGRGDPRRAKRLTLAGFAAAAAAGVALFLMSPNGWEQQREPTLPAYSVEVLHATSQQRSHGANRQPTGSGTQPIRFSADAPPVFVLRPAQAHAASSKIEVLVKDKKTDGSAGGWRAFPHRLERSPGGSVRISFDDIPSVPAGTLGIAIRGPGETAPTTFDPAQLRLGRDFLIEFEVSDPGGAAATPNPSKP